MLTIKDLSASKELDRAAMASVRGGSHDQNFNFPNDLMDFVSAYQADAIDISHVYGSQIFIDSDKTVETGGEQDVGL